MAEQKTPAAMKAAATGAVSGQTKTSRTTATATRKSAAKTTAEPGKKAPVAKKSLPTEEPKKTKAATAKKAAPAAEKKATVKKASAAKSEVKARPTPEERYRMVQTAAYFIAERNGFQGYPADHWLQAELEIAAQLRE
jgi:hypothetical protein